MEYRSLGRTGVKVSPICLGCMQFGGSATAEEGIAMIDRALDAGINFLDVANVYNRGRSEEAIGEALRRNGKRQRVVLATKVFGRIDPEDPNGAGISRRHIIWQCEESLRRLRTDYIDLYQLHRPDISVPIDESLRALDDLVRAGKVRYIGTSTFPAWHIVESLRVSKALGLNRFICEQPPYNLLDRRIERELVPMARTFGIAVIPWSPLASGLLAGKYASGAEPAPGSRFADYRTKPAVARRFTAASFQVIDQLKPLAAEKGISLAQFSLAWCAQQPGITSPIIGPRTMEQLEDNIGALKVTFTQEDFARIDQIIPPGDFVSPFYDLRESSKPLVWI